MFQADQGIVGTGLFCFLHCVYPLVHIVAGFVGVFKGLFCTSFLSQIFDPIVVDGLFHHLLPYALSRGV